jgi:uncharacterized protein YndB with AHSA1/START domain
MKDLVTAKVTHKFENVSAEEVYDAWLNEEDVRAWSTIALKTHGLGADLRRIEIDPRVGGKFFFSDMREGVEAEHWGTYRALDRPHLIEFTWFTSQEEEEKYTSIVRIEILPEDSGCTVTISHTIDAIFAEYLEPTEKGWATMLEAIARLRDRRQPSQ